MATPKADSKQHKASPLRCDWQSTLPCTRVVGRRGLLRFFFSHVQFVHTWGNTYTCHRSFHRGYSTGTTPVLSQSSFRGMQVHIMHRALHWSEEGGGQQSQPGYLDSGQTSNRATAKNALYALQNAPCMEGGTQKGSATTIVLSCVRMRY